MPTYTLRNKRTEETWQTICSYNVLKDHILNDEVELVPVMPNIVSGVGNLHSKTDDGWKDNLRRIKAGSGKDNTIKI